METDAPAEMTAAAGHAEGGSGLPQFDASMWPGQIAWLLIIFLVVFLIMRFVIVPRIGGTIDGRDEKIQGDINDARRMKDEADASAEAAAADLAQARAQAQKTASDARAKAQAEMNARLAEEEAKLAETTSAAEARIAEAREKAMTSVAEIGAETAGVIVEHLTGKAASAAELKAVRA